MKIGIDLGGTKIEGILMDDTGLIKERTRIATPRGSYKDIVACIAGFIDSLDHTKKATIGIGTPGSISPSSGLMRGANTTELNGQPLLSDLQEVLKRPIRIANDANCFALSEAVDGAGAGSSSVFGVIIGTGTGAGIVLDGKILNGHNSIGGEWGHNPLPWLTQDGRECYCGKQNCIETYLSGPGFSLSYQKISGQDLQAEAIIALARQGEKAAIDTLELYAEQMAAALSHIINIIDPETIVLGGGMSNITELYTLVPAKLLRYCFADQIRTHIRPALHGDSSGVRGAAWLW